MQYRQLGRSGIQVSPLCLGTMMFGGQTDERTAQAIADRALEQGVNFIDTANVYNAGKSEEVVGRHPAKAGHIRMGNIPGANKGAGRHRFGTLDLGVSQFQASQILARSRPAWRGESAQSDRRGGKQQDMTSVGHFHFSARLSARSRWAFMKCSRVFGPSGPNSIWPSRLSFHFGHSTPPAESGSPVLANEAQ